MGQINVAIIGVGNCASALVQGVNKYKEAEGDKQIPGIMHNELGGYSVGDLNIVAAFDVDEDKVGKDLYEYWGDTLSNSISEELKSHQHNVVVNCASIEYFRSIDRPSLNAEVITPQFKEYKNGKLKMISFFAKKARGVMARYIIQKGLNEPEGLKRFKGDGYYYSPEHSKGNNWVFLRDAPPRS